MLEIMVAREAAVMVASAAAAYTDLKTGHINDWITYPLIALGALLNIYEQQWAGILLGAAVFALGYVLYYTGKVGGGDVKLYSGIAFALPFYGRGIFVVPAALLAALLAVVFFSVYYISKYYRRGIDFGYNAAGIRRAGILLAVIIVYFFVARSSGIVSPGYIAVIGLPMLLGVAFMALEKGIRKEFFVQRIKVRDMEEDELIALDFMEEDERKKIERKAKWVLGEKEKRALENAGVEEIAVYRNLPRFGPFIFIGVAVALAVPEITALLAGGI